MGEDQRYKGLPGPWVAVEVAARMDVSDWTPPHLCEDPTRPSYEDFNDHDDAVDAYDNGLYRAGFVGLRKLLPLPAVSYPIVNARYLVTEGRPHSAKLYASLGFKVIGEEYQDASGRVWQNVQYRAEQT